jgi:hypothetical protein
MGVKLYDTEINAAAIDLENRPQSSCVLATQKDWDFALAQGNSYRLANTF